MEREEKSLESLRSLCKKYSVDILSGADEPATAKELKSKFDIPVATCYRRLEELTEYGFLEYEGTVVSDDLRSADAYRRRVEEINITFTDGQPELSVQKRSRVESTLDDAWDELVAAESDSSHS